MNAKEKTIGATGSAHGIAASLSDNPELLRRMARVFVEDCPRLLSDLDKALQSYDLGAVEAAAHALKSSVGNFGKGEAFQAAARLEHVAFHGNLADVKRIAASLVEHVQQLSQDLAETEAKIKRLGASGSQ